MKGQGLRDFWRNLTGQRPQMETNNTGVPVTIINSTSSDLFQNVPSTLPTPNPSQSNAVSDGEKTGATLLFSGIFLGLVGTTFTAMGWLNYNMSHSLEWTQMLGPILLSVGGTFMLISVCKFGMLSCQSCRPRDEEEDVMSELEQIPTRQSFMFNGISQPNMIHGTTVVQYIPSPYASVAQEVNPADGSANGVPRNLPPQYCTVCPLNNPAFTVEEDSSSGNRETGCRVSRVQETERPQDDEKGCDDEDSSICPLPPAYEDIYPSLQTENSL